MPTVFIEPFGFSGVEAQLCGVPLIATSYGAFQETILEGVTGYRCHTLADWVEAIRLSGTLDRRQIATLARGKYSKEAVGKQYDWVLRQLGTCQVAVGMPRSLANSPAESFRRKRRGRANAGSGYICRISAHSRTTFNCTWIRLRAMLTAYRSF